MTRIDGAAEQRSSAPVRHKVSHSQQVATTGELEARRSEAEQPALTAENRRMPCIMYSMAEIFRGQKMLTAIHMAFDFFDHN